MIDEIILYSRLMNRRDGIAKLQLHGVFVNVSLNWIIVESLIERRQTNYCDERKSWGAQQLTMSYLGVTRHSEDVFAVGKFKW